MTPTIDKQLTEASFPGRQTLLVFWATWCGPCVRKFPMLTKLQNEYADKKLRIVSVSLDSTKEFIDGFRKKRDKMPWEHAILLGKHGQKLREKFEIAGIPKMMLIGPRGRVNIDFFQARLPFFQSHTPALCCRSGT